MTTDTSRAAAGSLAWFVFAPGGVVGLVPWLITRWRGDAPAWAQVAGAALVIAGTLPVVVAFVQFVVEGRGTPAPPAPTEELVVGGLYRRVRNPMYVGVLTAIAGQALMFASIGLLVWLGAVALMVTGFVVLYEEPTLRETYGVQYDEYAAAVPRWLPRLRPWHSNRGRAVGGTPTVSA